jgi:leader peptidase (prepilin peptidase) / N-methyltransferase
MKISYLLRYPHEVISTTKSITTPELRTLQITNIAVFDRSSYPIFISFKLFRMKGLVIMFLIYACYFILGLVFGSFFNVIGLRVPLKKSIVSPRSACSNCGHTLHPSELIPVFSYVLQKGKCRNCGAHISILYPLIELLTGCLFVFALIQIGFQMELLIALSLISLLVIIVVSDLAYMLIPDRILLLFLLIFIIERFFIPLDSWWNSIIGALGAFVVILLIALVSNGGMGGGDIKLFGVLGFV